MIENRLRFAAFYFGKGEKPCFSIFFAGDRMLLVAPHTYPPAEFFEQEEGPASVNWKAQVWASSRMVRVFAPEGEARLPMADVANSAWRTGLARMLVSNAVASLYRLDAVTVGTTLIVR